MKRGDAFDPNSPARAVLDRVCDKWTMLVLLSLRDGPRRFTQIRDTIGGISPKVLTQTLRAMAGDGLVTRHVFTEVPLRVEYDLTALGFSLQDPVEAVIDWAELKTDAVMAARHTHRDQRPD
jgi:DNA-binding HxlR family transcriptional regulator